MIISVDTKNDSPEDIKKAIALLESLILDEVDERSSHTMKKPQQKEGRDSNLGIDMLSYGYGDYASLKDDEQHQDEESVMPYDDEAVANRPQEKRKDEVSKVKGEKGKGNIDESVFKITPYL